MRTFQATTNEIDDLDFAVAELKSQIDTFPLDENTFGLVMFGSEVDSEALAPKLWEALKIHCIGLSVLGVMQNDGYSEASICINIMTASDVFYQGGVTEIIEHNEIDRITDKYKELSAKMKEKEKLILLYIPWFPELAIDDMIDRLDELSGGIPIYGGSASDDWDFKDIHVLLDGNAFSNRAVMVLLGGNIKPIFLTEASAIEVPDSRGIVTSAEGVVVKEIDGLSATDYIKKIGLDTYKDFVVSDYLGSPFYATKSTSAGERIRLLRNLCMINRAGESLAFLGRIEEGDEICMSSMTVENIEKTTGEAFGRLLEQINSSEDYKFSLIVTASCAARYCFIVADKNKETRGYLDKLPEGVNIIGGYMYGEFCPALDEAEKPMQHNVLNNETFTIMAL